jgi:glutathione S-transferase
VQASATATRERSLCRSTAPKLSSRHPEPSTEQGNWLAGKAMSLADLSAAAHLSVTDYFGDIDWDRHPEARQWYAKIKSRPSFRDLLADVVAGLTPAAHYADLDF